MKKILAVLVLCFFFALPAQAEVSGVYVGLKALDSIVNTGQFSKEGFSGTGLGQYGKNTFGGGIFVGYDFYPQQQVPLRAELEYSLRNNAEESWSKNMDDDRGKVTHRWNAQTLFANVYYDFHNSTAFTPYIGAGIGLAFVNTELRAKDMNTKESDSINKMSTSFAWNAGLGLAYAFNENFSADLAYRFVSFGYTSLEKDLSDEDGIDKMEISSTPYANEFSLALRYTF